MRIDSLERHMADTMKEWQMKIGCSEEPIGLYYPAASLKSLLDLSEGENLDEALNSFAEAVRPRFGELEITQDRDRYCLIVGAQGNHYVNEQIETPEFLSRLLELLGKKEKSLDDIRSLCHDYADKYQLNYIEKDGHHEGLGYVFYFEPQEPEPYVYCVEDDGFGITYHRFGRDDYEEMTD